MKKITSLLLVVAMLVVCVFAFTSCNMIRFGKYEAEVDAVVAGGKTTIEFTLMMVKVTSSTTILGSTNTEIYEGTYSIEGEEGDLQIIFDFDGEAPSAFSADSYDFSEGEDEDGKYVKIGLVKYHEAK
jgi:hypothetical protein